MRKKEKLKAKTAGAVNKSKPPVAKAKEGKKAKSEKRGKADRKSKIGNKGFQVAVSAEKAEIVSSEVVWEGSLFKVRHDKLIEPGGHPSERDVVRHNGSVIILALDKSKSKKDPWLVIERQYRHAANQFLWELPAGKLDAGEEPLAGAKRELAEETGYSAKKWKPLVEYYASPGFLGESMTVFLAEGLIAGEARPEEDEQIDFRLVKLSEVLKMIEKGAIHDGKTLIGVLLYVRLASRKGKK